jgi:uncharacterized protein (DUF2235 family)
LRGGIFGKGLGKNVLEAYTYIVKNYAPQDQIYLFGFSRGAYTVRSLGGLIRNSGVLRRENLTLVDAAYDLYRRRDPQSHPTEKEAEQFRRDYSHDPAAYVYFIGVWDTVGSLGIPSGIPGLRALTTRLNQRHEFHDTQCSSTVTYAYQALAIDERRRQFEPALWVQKPEDETPTMEQAWFAGVHSSVGGGSKDNGLSDQAFLWMMEKAKAAGLTFDEA